MSLPQARHLRVVTLGPWTDAADRRAPRGGGLRPQASVHVAEDAPVVSDDALERLLELLLSLLLVELHEDLLWGNGGPSVSLSVR